LETAAKANRVESRAFANPAEAVTAKEMKTIGDMKKIAGTPWRADEKSAAMAACAMLSPRRSSAR